MQVPLLPKLRGHFAEFLNHDSLDRLSILYLITCVGLGYGQLEPHADAFLDSIGSPNPPTKGVPSRLRPTRAHLTTRYPTRLDHDNHRVARLPSCVTPVNTLTSTNRALQHTQTPTQKSMGSKGFSQLASKYQYGRSFVGTGISTRYPSTTPVGLALGPD